MEQSLAGFGELTLDGVVKTAAKLQAENDALRDRAVGDLSAASRPMDVGSYFRAYKLIKEGHIKEALYEMEQTLDKRAGGQMSWRSWI